MQDAEQRGGRDCEQRDSAPNIDPNDETVWPAQSLAKSGRRPKASKSENIGVPLYQAQQCAGPCGLTDREGREGLGSVSEQKYGRAAYRVACRMWEERCCLRAEWLPSTPGRL